MNEERRLAAKGNYESPVWDILEETHHNYNKNVEMLINNAREKDVLFVASHNVDTVAKARKLVSDHNF
eukprot:CAMPEP_0170567120 /NCGR_PEP_ID=MMETSP0211-20121228/80283_1 /TAXON_ID=311385 /ORGANISM="Pseudokeronopsis sp., Strain OXSARD2" /LENGTH=67 /DNA_ID=CAMNT_0010888495 /DNA_START=441 /DNA_END=644 /DNA_ORIENTATION=+